MTSFTRVALSPDPDLAIAALMIARIEYPDARRRALPRASSTSWAARPPRGSRGQRSRPDTPPGIDPAGLCARRRAQRLPVSRAALRRQRRPLRGSAQQFSQRGARPPDRHPDHAGAGLHGGRAPRRRQRRRHQLPGSLSGAVPGAARTARLGGSDHRRVSRRRAAVGRRLPRAAAPPRRRGRRVRLRALRLARPSRRFSRACC